MNTTPHQEPGITQQEYCCRYSLRHTRTTQKVTPFESSCCHHRAERAASARAARWSGFDPKLVATTPWCQACSPCREHRVCSVVARNQTRGTRGHRDNRSTRVLETSLSAPMADQPSAQLGHTSEGTMRRTRCRYWSYCRQINIAIYKTKGLSMRIQNCEKAYRTCRKEGSGYSRLQIPNII